MRKSILLAVSILSFSLCGIVFAEENSQLDMLPDVTIELVGAAAVEPSVTTTPAPVDTSTDMEAETEEAADTGASGKTEREADVEIDSEILYDESDDLFPVDSETIATVQWELSERGYYDGVNDGVMGEGTRGAIIKYKQDHNIGSTGDITYKLLESLHIAMEPFFTDDGAIGVESTENPENAERLKYFSSKTRLYTEASTASDIAGTVSRNDQATIGETSMGWTQVRHRNKVAYVPTIYLMDEPYLALEEAEAARVALEAQLAEHAAPDAGAAPVSELFSDTGNDASSAPGRTAATGQWVYWADNSETAYSYHLYSDCSRLSRSTVVGGTLAECPYTDLCDECAMRNH